MLGNKSGSNKGVLKALGVAAAPTPLNTPSLKRENNGRDVNAVLVPVGSGVWGNKGGAEERQGDFEDTSTQQEPTKPTSEAVSATEPVSAPKTAPWAVKENSDRKPATSQDPNKEKKSSRLRSWIVEDSDDDSSEDEEEVTFITQFTSFYRMWASLKVVYSSLIVNTTGAF